jgi:hypothetical protein
MGRYSSLAGKRVEAQYRAGEIRQRSIGTLVADTGTSITIEEHFAQGGRKKTMRVDIPYEYVIRVIEAPKNSESPAPAAYPSRRIRR